MSKVRLELSSMAGKVSFCLLSHSRLSETVTLHDAIKTHISALETEIHFLMRQVDQPVLHLVSVFI
jgi:hypothetical protein